MMGNDEMKGSNKVFKQANKRQRHSNVGSTNSMRLEPNLTPCLEHSVPIRPFVYVYSCG